MKRNFILGMVFVAIFTLVAVLRAQAPSRAVQTPYGPNQRYQIIINPSMRADTFLLDTQTGKIWQRTQFSDLVGEPEAWEVMAKVDNDADLASFYSSHRMIPKQTKSPTPESPLFNGILKDLPK